MRRRTGSPAWNYPRSTNLSLIRFPLSPLRGGCHGVTEGGYLHRMRTLRTRLWPRDRLAIALGSLDARIRAEGIPDGLVFDCSGSFFRNLGPDAMVNLTTRAGDVDLAFMPAGTRGFQDLRQDAIVIDVAGLSVPVASLSDVIRSKDAADRPKDRQALPRLRELLERTQVKRGSG